MKRRDFIESTCANKHRGAEISADSETVWLFTVSSNRTTIADNAMLNWRNSVAVVDVVDDDDDDDDDVIVVVGVVVVVVVVVFVVVDTADDDQPGWMSFAPILYRNNCFVSFVK